jgi:hypothetical protein
MILSLAFWVELTVADEARLARKVGPRKRCHLGERPALSTCQHANFGDSKLYENFMGLSHGLGRTRPKAKEFRTRQVMALTRETIYQLGGTEGAVLKLPAHSERLIS